MKTLISSKALALRAAMFVIALLAANLLVAQAPKPAASLAFTYTFQSGEGTNASAVTYIPEKDWYVTCIAGNADYPIEVFDRNGKTISSTTAGMDLRGIWYNPATKCIEANCYGTVGWVSRTISADGTLGDSWTTIREGQFQPDLQSVLAFIPKANKLVTPIETGFSFWGRKNGRQKVVFHHGTPGASDWYVNPFCAGYTGNDAYPLAILELNGEQVLFFDLKGKYLGATKIEGGLPEMDGFRFAFANRHAFIYDETARTWSAYRVF